MFNKKLKLQIEKLNKENKELRNELTLAKLATTREYNDVVIKLGAAQDKIINLEKDLKTATALQHQFYDECGKKETELSFYRHTMAAIRALSQNHMDFVVKRKYDSVYIEIHTFDTDREPVNILLRDGGWNIESPDGFNGMYVPGNYQVSMIDIILTEASDDEDEKELYRIAFDLNQLESLESSDLPSSNYEYTADDISEFNSFYEAAGVEDENPEKYPDGSGWQIFESLNGNPHVAENGSDDEEEYLDFDDDDDNDDDLPF